MALGIFYNLINEPKEIIVEKYIVTDYKRANKKLKNVNSKLTTKIIKDTLVLPLGSIIVPTNQKIQI
ncbi:MAG: hypothetical protein CM15mP59_0290 [Flavobacteriaceae bacterium]|nr:MAG: hypothetical protein CM15mP59_0290 [Flavobacteriaceae bacterium]